MAPLWPVWFPSGVGRSALLVHLAVHLLICPLPIRCAQGAWVCLVLEPLGGMAPLELCGAHPV